MSGCTHTIDPRQHRLRQYLLGLRVFSGQQVAWTLEELASRPLSASYHTEMRLSTAIMARDSGSCVPKGSGFEKPHRGGSPTCERRFVGADGAREFQFARGRAPGDRGAVLRTNTTL
jgi:hypothetical protein